MINDEINDDKSTKITSLFHIKIIHHLSNKKTHRLIIKENKNSNHEKSYNKQSVVQKKMRNSYLQRL